MYALKLFHPRRRAQKKNKAVLANLFNNQNFSTEHKAAPLYKLARYVALVEAVCAASSGFNQLRKCLPWFVFHKRMRHTAGR